MLFVFLNWSSLSELQTRLASVYGIPSIVWVGFVALLFAIALVHANARKRHEQEQTSVEHGWQFSKESSPIQETDWRQLSENSGLASLSSPGARHNFTYGIHRGVQFVPFEAPGLNTTPHDCRGYENLIAFRKPSQPSAIPHLTLGRESAAWEKFATNSWVFLRCKTPPWSPRGEQTVRFLEEAYQQLQIL